MSSTGLWACAILAISLLSLLIIYLIQRENNFTNELKNLIEFDDFTKSVINILDRSFSFIIILDSKLIGLVIFILSNVGNGILNLFFNLSSLSSSMAILVSCLNLFTSTLVPFTIFYFKYKN